MRTLTLRPSVLGVHTATVDDQPAGVLTFVGSGQLAELAFEVVISLAALGQLEAEISSARDSLRSADA